MEVSGQLYSPAALAHYPFDRKLCEFQSRFEQGDEEKMPLLLPLPGIETQSSSL
jgi:hypothetical protein